LTPKGLAARAKHPKLVEAVEQRWRARFGKDLDRLREALIVDGRLARGLHPVPGRLAGP
jgi:hypothetical protein